MSIEAEHKQTSLSEVEKLSWLRLFRTENVGPITFYKLVERYGSAAEALEALREPFKPVPSFSTPPANDDEIPENAQETILENLSFTPVTVDELLRSCHITIPVLQTVLLELELAGRIKREAGGRVALLNEE